LASKDIRKLVQVPFDPSVGMSSEAGIPIVEADSSSDEAKAFMSLAQSIRELLPV
jgi:MinD-like ATPase involved in chromosome partitioning or flagellar assembly